MLFARLGKTEWVDIIVMNKGSYVIYHCGHVYGRCSCGTGIFARMPDSFGSGVKSPSLIILFADAIDRDVIHYTVGRTRHGGIRIIHSRADDSGTLGDVLTTQARRTI